VCVCIKKTFCSLKLSKCSQRLKRINNNIFLLYTHKVISRALDLNFCWRKPLDRVYLVDTLKCEFMPAILFFFLITCYSLLGEWTMLNNYFSELVNKTDCSKHQDHWVSTLIMFSRTERLQIDRPSSFFPGSLGLVFVYMDSSSLSLLRMHNHNFLFAFFHTSQFSMITPHIL